MAIIIFPQVRVYLTAQLSGICLQLIIFPFWAHIYYNSTPLKILAIFTYNVDLILKVQQSVCGLQRCFSNIQHLIVLCCLYSSVAVLTSQPYFFHPSWAKTENCNIYEKHTYTSFHGGFQMNKNEGRKCVSWYILFVYHTCEQLAALSLRGPSVKISSLLP